MAGHASALRRSRRAHRLRARAAGDAADMADAGLGGGADRTGAGDSDPARPSHRGEPRSQRRRGLRGLVPERPAATLAARGLAAIPSAPDRLAARDHRPPSLAENQILVRALGASPAGRGRDRADRALWAAFTAAMVAAVGLRVSGGLRRGPVVTYPNGRSVRGASGATLLEISRAAGVPHASVCGGRGRCTTCRVLVLEGTEELPLPED